MRQLKFEVAMNALQWHPAILGEKHNKIASSLTLLAMT
jgi:hypothetical protein